MSDGRCATCRFWYSAEDDADWEFSDLKFLPCKAVPHRESARIEAQGGESFDDYEAAEKRWHEKLATMKALVTDASGYSATLWTSAAFGCVLYEARL